MQYTHKGHTYDIALMRPLVQLRVVKKLLPSIGAALPLIAGGSAPSGAEIIGRVIDSVSTMAEGEIEELTHVCLAVVTRQAAPGVGQGWAPVWNAPAGEFMFADLTIVDGLALVAQVLKVNFGPFFDDPTFGGMLPPMPVPLGASPS